MERQQNDPTPTEAAKQEPASRPRWAEAHAGYTCTDGACLDLRTRYNYLARNRLCPDLIIRLPTWHVALGCSEMVLKAQFPSTLTLPGTKSFLTLLFAKQAVPTFSRPALRTTDSSSQGPLSSDLAAILTVRGKNIVFVAWP